MWMKTDEDRELMPFLAMIGQASKINILWTLNANSFSVIYYTIINLEEACWYISWSIILLKKIKPPLLDKNEWHHGENAILTNLPYVTEQKMSIHFIIFSNQSNLITRSLFMWMKMDGNGANAFLYHYRLSVKDKYIFELECQIFLVIYFIIIKIYLEKARSEVPQVIKTIWGITCAKELSQIILPAFKGFDVRKNDLKSVQ